MTVAAAVALVPHFLMVRIFPQVVQDSPHFPMMILLFHVATARSCSGSLPGCNVCMPLSSCDGVLGVFP